MTIFGFNTDVKYGDTVYHVQSEGRRGELVIQTMVFVKGQCIGKRAIPYTQETDSESVHAQLKAQHKMVIDAINEGSLDSVLAANGDGHHNPSSSNGHAGNGHSNGQAHLVTLEFQITDAGQGISGVEVVSRSEQSVDGSVLARALSDASGIVKMSIPVNVGMQNEAITVEASYGGRSFVRKFKVKELPKLP
jgi:hypothetical protein